MTQCTGTYEILRMHACLWSSREHLDPRKCSIHLRLFPGCDMLGLQKSKRGTSQTYGVLPLFRRELIHEPLHLACFAMLQ